MGVKLTGKADTVLDIHNPLIQILVHEKMTTFNYTVAQSVRTYVQKIMPIKCIR